MPSIIRSDNRDFESFFQTLLLAKREDSPDVDATVAQIISDVRELGDAAVIDLTEQFDGIALTPDTMAFSESEINEEISKVTVEEAEALQIAADRIRAYHERQLPEDASWEDETGAMLGWRWTPVDAAGLYVPGGTASYPSSVLMNAIPAQVAGVKELSICCPTPGGQINPLVLLAAQISGVDTIYRIGGAQAIAALAYGTESIAKVDKITGPGNAFVAAAKRRVFGQVGIDMIAGPSEVLVIADKHNNPDWIAMDLLSQAEHDKSAQSILITDNQKLARSVKKSVEHLLTEIDRADIAGASWEEFGALIVVDDLDQAAELANRIAPEHLELCVAEPEELAAKIRHAGAIFLGGWTPEAVGDYVGGPNHVLPTARSARFSSGLSVLDFMKRTTLSKLTPSALAQIGPAAEVLAHSESLQAHAASIGMRLEQINEED